MVYPIYQNNNLHITKYKEKFNKEATEAIEEALDKFEQILQRSIPLLVRFAIHMYNPPLVDNIANYMHLTKQLGNVCYLYGCEIVNGNLSSVPSRVNSLVIDNSTFMNLDTRPSNVKEVTFIGDLSFKLQATRSDLEYLTFDGEHLPEGTLSKIKAKNLELDGNLASQIDLSQIPPGNFKKIIFDGDMTNVDLCKLQKNSVSCVEILESAYAYDVHFNRDTITIEKNDIALNLPFKD